MQQEKRNPFIKLDVKWKWGKQTGRRGVMFDVNIFLPNVIFVKCSKKVKSDGHGFIGSTDEKQLLA